MKVLVLGMNYASTMNSLVIGLKEIEVNVESISFEEDRSIYNDFSQISCVFSSKKKSYFSHKIQFIKGLLKLRKAIKNATIIHVYSDFQIPTKYRKQIENWLFMRLAKNKKKYITFVGSEVRNPEIEKLHNPYYGKVLERKDYEYHSETKEGSIAHQKRFSRLQFSLICTPDTEHYIDKTLYETNKITLHPGIVNQLSIKNNFKEKIILVHAPSAPIAKGTPQIEEVIHKLKAKYSHIEYKTLSGLTLDEYKNAVTNCSIYIDQIIWGYHGVAAIQAMALGKPVICYLHPSPLQFTPTIPMINANPDTLFEVIEKIIIDKVNLNELGELTRNYYLGNHTPKVIASKMIEHYQTK